MKRTCGLTELRIERGNLHTYRCRNSTKVLGASIHDKSFELLVRPDQQKRTELVLVLALEQDVDDTSEVERRYLTLGPGNAIDDSAADLGELTHVATAYVQNAVPILVYEVVPRAVALVDAPPADAVQQGAVQ